MANTWICFVTESNKHRELKMTAAKRTNSLVNNDVQNNIVDLFPRPKMIDPLENELLLEACRDWFSRGDVSPSGKSTKYVCDMSEQDLRDVYGDSEKAAIEVTVRPGDRVVIRGEHDDAADDEPYRSPVKISARARVVDDVDIVENVKK